MAPPPQSILAYVTMPIKATSPQAFPYYNASRINANSLDRHYRRQRTPLLIGTFLAGSSIFIGLKWRAVMQRSEATKKATSKPANYSVDTGRSG